MGKIIDWIGGFFNRDIGSLDLDVCIGELSTSLAYKEMVLFSAIDLIADTISLAEFRTYQEQKLVYKDDYYLFNVEPNPNISGSHFWKKVVFKMVTENEALVIMQNDKLYLVDEFTKKEFAFKENIYTNMKIGDLDLRETLRESQVLHFQYNNKDMVPVISGIYKDLSELLGLSMKSFSSSKVNKGTLEIDTLYPQTDEAQTKLKEIVEVRFKEYLNSNKDAVLPLPRGLKFNKDQQDKTGVSDTRETREVVNDIIELFAMALKVPPNLLKGEITDKSGDMNLFLTTCIQPLTETFVNEVNRKFYTKEQYLKGTYLIVDTNNIKVKDLSDIAGSLDILTRIGAYNINDSLEALNMERIPEPWANQRFMTKNYEPIEKMIQKKDQTD